MTSRQTIHWCWGPVLGALCLRCFSPTGKTPPAETTSAEAAEDSTGGSSTSDAEPFPSSSDTSTSALTSSTAPATSTGQACGDGVIDDGEECDDMGTADGDGCSSACLKEYRRVFVTSDLFTGNLNGVGEADARCQEAASKVGFNAEFKAWLSSSEGSPQQNFTRSEVEYRDVMGTTVADDWNALVTGNLKAGIYLTEDGETATSGPHPCIPSDIVVVWSNTLAAGTQQSETKSCGSWTGEGEGAVGRLGALDSSWTSACVVPCTTMAPLYCFEQ